MLAEQSLVPTIMQHVNEVLAEQSLVPVIMQYANEVRAEQSLVPMIMQHVNEVLAEQSLVPMIMQLCMKGNTGCCEGNLVLPCLRAEETPSIGHLSA